MGRIRSLDDGSPRFLPEEERLQAATSSHSGAHHYLVG